MKYERGSGVEIKNERTNMIQIDGAMVNSRAVRVSDVFKVAEELVKDPREVVLNFRYGMNEYRAYAEEVTLVLSRDLRTTAEISCGIAMRLALRFPERNVLVFNTYAGADLLTEGFV